MRRVEKFQLGRAEGNYRQRRTHALWSFGEVGPRFPFKRRRLSSEMKEAKPVATSKSSCLFFRAYCQIESSRNGRNSSFFKCTLFIGYERLGDKK
mmetsp:Transcript_2464/g.3897  ORF Transcript_2464/g.3897 Transcript_2464/m.3897 type:complete len:95 (+) Transcript_2464:356-640(+)